MVNRSSEDRQEPRLRVHAVLVLGALLASCDYTYGVVRRAPAPPGFDPQAAQAALRQLPGYLREPEWPWNGKSMCCWLQRDLAQAQFAFDRDPRGNPDGVLELNSVWFNHPPDDAELTASLRLQEEVRQFLSERLPGIPPAEAFVAEWLLIPEHPCVPAAPERRP